MAIFHFSAKVIGRAAGRSAVAASAYRAGERLHDERLDRDHDFRAKSGVEHSEIMLPEGAPERFSDRATLWNEIEGCEKRKDAQLAREVEFSIPREMSKVDGIELARDFVQTEFVDRGMIADLNVHWDIGADGMAKPHAHVMLTMREVSEDGFGQKVRDWNRTELIEQWRERWADHLNARLAELDIDARIDHRSLEAQGIDLEPQDKIGPAASRTIASMEHGWSQGRDLLGPRDVLVIDEAGMVGTRQMERVLGHAADAGAKVVLVGDPQQLQAIEAGAAFRAIHERHGGVEITEVRRQQEGWQQDATRHLATGRTGEAIRAYADHGMVHAAETRKQARSELVERWDRERIAAPDRSRIILTHTNDEVRTLNEAARDRMRAAGELGDDARVKTERGDRAFASGDRIMFLRNERGLEVKNGTLGTIEQVNERSMTVRTDVGRSVSFDTKDYAHVDHGYAATIHKAQGMTVDRSHVLATPGLDRHGAYVGMSRHRDGIAFHYGRDDFKNEARLVRTLSRERAKDMASDYQAARDPAQQFAERRGISFGERIKEIARTGAEKARGIFDGLRLTLPGQDRSASPAPERQGGIFANFRPSAPSTDRAMAAQSEREVVRRLAVERHARAVADIWKMQDKGLPVLPHQRAALDKAREAMSKVDSHAAKDMESAYRRDPALIMEAAGGRSQRAIQAMQLETEVRADPALRADRFVQGWRQLRQAQDDLRRDGDFRGAKRVGQEMAGLAKSLDRDAQMESVLRGRKRELGINIDSGRQLSQDLASSVGIERGRDLGMSR